MLRIHHCPIVVCLVLCTVTGWATTEVVAETLGTQEVQACHLDGYRQEALCGSHSVFEDRAAARGRRIDIQFAVIPAIDDNAEPDPFVIFAGGPGQSAISLAPIIRSTFAGVNKRRDIVLIDQRGMGSSHPLDCDTPEDEILLSLSAKELEQRSRELLQACLADLDADVTLYTQDLANEDIHEILEALGYSRINLYGGSWGTRSALLYAHRFANQVRSIVLDGALPIGNMAPSHAGADAQSALRRLFEDCAADAGCAQAFPTLEADYRTALELLPLDGADVTVEDPASGATQHLLLTPNRFAGALRDILYIPDLSRVVPLMIKQASVGDYRAWLGVSGFLAQSSAGSLTVGASLTIFCSEELGRMPPDQLATDAPQNPLGDSLFGNLKNACSVWPRAPLPAIYNEDVGSQAPTLILSGELDPITPPRWGEEIAKALPNSLHLIATAVGHGVAPRGCAPDVIEQFIATADPQEIDGSCLSAILRPSFFINASGPEVVTHHD